MHGMLLKSSYCENGFPAFLSALPVEELIAQDHQSAAAQGMPYPDSINAAPGTHVPLHSAPL